MPPKSSRKRPATGSSPPPAKRRATPRSAPKKGKQTLFDAIDDKRTVVSTPEETKAFLDKLGDSDSSDLSAVDSDDFEDVPLTKKRKSDQSKGEHKAVEDDDDDDEDEMDWEDAIQAEEGASKEQDCGVADDDIGDVSISINENGSRVVAGTELAASKLKKGPSKRERLVRNGTHCIHTQALMWHNAIRNSWLNDKELQKILSDGLSEGVWQEVDRWREDMGLPEQDRPGKSKKKKSKGKKDKRKSKDGEKRDGRDWGIDADRLEKGAVNMSRGDPLLRLLKILTAYWRKRFTVNAPGLRKQGYMPIKRLAVEVNAWKKDHNDVERFGERLESVTDLRRLAKTCEGSRDVGAQLFVALLRGLGLDVRLVANLQPAGIGWGKVEEAHPPKVSQKDKNDEEEDDEAGSPKKKKKRSRGAGKKKPTNKADLKAALTPTATRKSTRTSNAEIITIDSDDDDESALSSAPEDVDDDDDASIIEVTPTSAKKSKKKYDRDLHFPHYWAEVISSVSNQVIPVDPIVLSTVATNGELLATFEPRGKLADQAKQVMCYTIAHAADGSAKDVTVRYLKKHQLPGRTKGYRMPVERIKVLNKRGKVRKYEDYDWFKTVMSAYERSQKKRAAADDLEESTDLKPFKPVDEKKGVEVESLQWYKQSAEFVLERHLRREEALLPTAKPVRTFTAGKGDKATEEPVYRRKDVVNCKTAESWHKEGREIVLGEQPMKLVKMRAVTTMRKREIEEIERETGETAKQGLFARSQTDWIIPPPIGDDRQIPRNAFGNIDVYVPSMVPKGAVHIPLKGTARVCRDLNISHAEACTGFEFGKRMAIPILTGVVVAEENENAVMELWQEREAEKKRKEDTKREAQMLGLWRKFVMGMRIVERMKAEYAGSGSAEEINPFVRRAKQQAVDRGEEEQGKEEAQELYESFADHAAGGGGFFHEGEGEEDEQENKRGKATVTVTTDGADMEGGGFLMKDEEQELKGTNGTNGTKAPVKPMSLAEAMKHREQANGDDDEDDLSEMEEEPVKAVAKSRRKTPAKSATQASTGKKTPTPRRGRKSLQPPTSPSEDDEDEEVLSDEEVEEKPAKSRTSRQSSGRSSAKKSPAKAKRVTSPYFSHEEMDDDDMEVDDDDDDDDGEEEVVKPRATTARTRGRAK